MKLYRSGVLGMLVTSVILLVACTTVATPAATEPPPPVQANSVPKAAAVVSVQAPAAGKPLAPECPVVDTVCTMEFNPMVCSAATYAGQTQEPSKRLIAWGANTCAARLLLQKAACTAKLLPSKMGLIQCVPDSSGGHCPGAPADCHGAAATPSRCQATRYGDQKLTPTQTVAADGASECAAKAALKVAACRNNLDPDLLGDVVCQAVNGKTGS